MQSSGRFPAASLRPAEAGGSGLAEEGKAVQCVDVWCSGSSAEREEGHITWLLPNPALQRPDWTVLPAFVSYVWISFWQ